MQDARVRATLAALCLLIAAGSGAGLYASRRPAPPPVVITPPPAAVSALPPQSATPVPLPSPVAAVSKPALPPKLYVHVAGAVRHPSLYLLAPGSRVMMAIHAAGGPRPNADLDAVNLAEKVHDGEKVYIPVKTAAVATVMLAPPGNSITATGPIAAPPAPVRSAVKGAGTGKPGKLTSPAQGQVNLNTAGADQLQRLPGIGPAMAARILAYRQQSGGFQKPDDLLNVSGIGPKKFARLAPLVRLH